MEKWRNEQKKKKTKKKEKKASLVSRVSLCYLCISCGQMWTPYTRCWSRQARSVETRQTHHLRLPQQIILRHLRQRGPPPTLVPRPPLVRHSTDSSSPWSRISIWKKIQFQNTFLRNKSVLDEVLFRRIRTKEKFIWKMEFELFNQIVTVFFFLFFFANF